MPNSDTERERLETLAPDYDPHSDFDRYILTQFAQDIGSDIEGKDVLELGCATGLTASVLKEYAGTLDLVDGSETYVAIAKERVRGENTRVFCSLFEEFEPDRAYDVIICSHVLEHVEEPVSVLKRAAQWLKEDGALFVYVPNARSVHRQLGVKMGVARSIFDLSARDHQIGHRRVYDVERLLKDVRAAGLSPGEVHGILLKPLPISLLSTLSDEVIRGLVALGADHPEIAADIYVRCGLEKR